MKTTETYKAVGLLEMSDVIEIDNTLIHNWYLDSLDCDDDEHVLEISYEGDKGIFEFYFSKKSLMEAIVDGNSIEMKDDTDERVFILCYELNAVDLAK